MVGCATLRPPYGFLLADRIKSFSPSAVSAVKRAVTQGLDLPLSAGLELEKRLALGLLT
jgi:enoyl-CoA hydratase/carnithine racemase